MDVIKEFKYLCYQLDYSFGKGNLIDSDFSETNFNDDKLSLNDIEHRLLILKSKSMEMEDLPPLFTKTYLQKHIDALLMQIKLKKQNTDYIEAISILYDIDAKKPQHTTIEQIHSELNDLLKNNGYISGTLNQRVQQWNKDNDIKASDFVDLINKKAKEYAEIVKGQFSNIVNFNEINDVLDLKLVDTNDGWAAYNYYINNYKGIIEFNNSSSFNQYSINLFISHEGYPGHHTSCLIKEYLYKNNQTNELATINLLNTPSSLIEEGIGDNGLKILNLENDNINFKIDQLLDKLSAEAYYLATYKYINEKQTEEQIINILINDKLHANEKSAYRAMQFIKNWGYYIPTYKYGREIVSAFIDKHPNDYINKLYNICCNSTLEK